MQRLDRILSEAGVASRKELRAIIRAGRVTADGAVVTDESRKLLIRWSPALLSRFDIKSCRFCCEFYMDAVCEFLRRWNYVWQMSICLMDCCIFGTGRMVVKDLSPCPNR